MTHTFKRGDRVRIKGGSRAGKTGKLTRPHGGEGFAGYWSIWIDGTEWDAPGFAAPAEALELIPA
jgi:hypothetical protein